MEMIGAYEAKRHFDESLERAEHGEHLTITRHGEPAAQLIPVTLDRKQAQQEAARLIDRTAPSS
ncbi:MAG: type II toxin-antitoxin system prevent-host-death family antitoxin [Candidatus Tectomicrobia bacterium]|nr:type II toxin-antitoxin system prevent-host-death family antitoxin [Candidatus Tectomicrobia bacterium]